MHIGCRHTAMAAVPAPEPDMAKLTFENYIKMTKFNVSEEELLGAFETAYNFVGDLKYEGTTLSAEEEELQMLMESDLSDTVSDFSQISLNGRPRRKKKRSERWRSRTSSVADTEYQKEQLRESTVSKYESSNIKYLAVREESGKSTPKSGRSSRSSRQVVTPIIEKHLHDNKTSAWSEKVETSDSSGTSTPTPTNNRQPPEKSHRRQAEHEKQRYSKPSRDLTSNNDNLTIDTEQRRRKRHKSGRKSKPHDCWEENNINSVMNAGALDELLGRNMRATERKSKRKLNL